ncbi:hypothetical protein Tco_0591608 [Tanacetum coccineum]
MNMLTNLTMQKKNPSGSRSLPSNTVANPRGDVKAITTRSGVAYDGPTILPTPSPPPKDVERETEATKDKVQTTNLRSTVHVQPLVVQVPILEPDVAPKPKPKPSIPYPLRLNEQKLREKANYQMLKFLQIFQRLHFDLSFADALLHLVECLSLTDLGASIKLMPLSVLDYDVDPRVPLIIGRPFLRTAQALVDYHFYTDSSPSLTPVETSDSLLEELADELALLDSFPPGIGDADFDSEGDILLLEKLLNNDPLSPLPSKELNFEELKMIKSSIDAFPPLDVLGGNSVIFSNPLFDANGDFTFSDDELPHEADAPEENFKIYSNPLFEFDEEYISSDVNPLFNKELEDIESNDSYVSNLDEPVLSVTPLFDANEDGCFDPVGNIDEINAFLDMDVSTVIEVGYHNSEGDEIFLEYLLKKIASMDSSLLFSSGSEDIIFDPGIPVFSFYSLEPMVSHRSRTFMCFNVILNILNEVELRYAYSPHVNVPNIQ